MAVIELVTFKLSEGANEDEFIHASKEMEEDMQNIKGYIKRELIKHPDGRYGDLVHWESMDAAKEAMDQAMQMQGPQKYFTFIDESSIDMNHYDVVDHFN